MINVFFATIHQTFILLCREKVFLLMLFVSLVTFLLCGLFADLSIESAQSTLVAFGFLCFHILGAGLALLSGSRLFSDLQVKGSLAANQLIHKTPRTVWLVARFIGLLLFIFLAGILLQLIWQGLLMVWGYPRWQYEELVIFSVQSLEWLVLGSLAGMLSLVVAPATALFLGLCLWFGGLISAASYYLLSQQTDSFANMFFLLAERLWNLDKFNLARFYGHENFPSQETVLWLPVYAVCLCVIFISLAAIFFERKDVM